MSSRSIKDSGSVTVLVIGAGHAGLSISACLTEHSIDHVLLERGEVAESWRTQRWDSLRLLTPNWQVQLPGSPYAGTDPDGFMPVSELRAHIETYASLIQAPVRSQTTVLSVTRENDVYLVSTDRGIWRCQSLVLANGICSQPAVPAIAESLPSSIRQMSPLDYRCPQQLEQGGVLVVGASASGLQLAEEIQASGRQVTLAIGEHVRMPRMYRGRDIHWWLDAAGILDHRIEYEEDINRARAIRSPQLIGSADRRTLDINAVQDSGVSVVGRVAAIRQQKILFSGSLRNCCALADQKMGRLLDVMDQWAEQSGLDAEVDDPQRFDQTRLPESPTLSLSLADRGIRTVIWATGFKPDYRWLNLPVVDKKGKLIHERGVVGTPYSDTPGLYAMGLSFMRKRKSSFIYGASDDAREIVNEIRSFLDARSRVNRCARPVVETHATNVIARQQLTALSQNQLFS